MTTLAEPRSPPERDETPDRADTLASSPPLVLTTRRVPTLRPRIVDCARLLARLDAAAAWPACLARSRPAAGHIGHHRRHCCDRECLLALDDDHLITAPAIHQVIAALLERRPDTSRVAIGTPLRSTTKVADVWEADLRFRREETAEFLNDGTQLAVESAVVAALEARTVGWIVAPLLAALPLAGRPVQT